MVANEKWQDNLSVVGTCTKKEKRFLCEIFIFQRKVEGLCFTGFTKTTTFHQWSLFVNDKEVKYQKSSNGGQSSY